MLILLHFEQKSIYRLGCWSEVNSTILVAFIINRIKPRTGANVREMIIGLRKLPDLAALLCLPQRVSQEDGTRDALVAVFQGMDKNDDRDITWDEFLEWFLEMRAKNSNVNNNSGAAASGESSGHQRIDTVAQSALVPLKSEILK